MEKTSSRRIIFHKIQSIKYDHHKMERIFPVVKFFLRMTPMCLHLRKKYFTGILQKALLAIYLNFQNTIRLIFFLFYSENSEKSSQFCCVCEIKRIRSLDEISVPFANPENITQVSLIMDVHKNCEN